MHVSRHVKMCKVDLYQVDTPLSAVEDEEDGCLLSTEDACCSTEAFSPAACCALFLPLFTCSILSSERVRGEREREGGGGSGRRREGPKSCGREAGEERGRFRREDAFRRAAGEVEMECGGLAGWLVKWLAGWVIG